MVLWKLLIIIPPHCLSADDGDFDITPVRTLHESVATSDIGFFGSLQAAVSEMRNHLAHKS